jgi:hypothetical protein
MSAMDATRRKGAPALYYGGAGRDWRHYHTRETRPLWLRVTVTTAIGLLALVPAVTSALEQYVRS